MLLGKVCLTITLFALGFIWHGVGNIRLHRWYRTMHGPHEMLNDRNSKICIAVGVLLALIAAMLWFTDPESLSLPDGKHQVVLQKPSVDGRTDYAIQSFDYDSRVAPYPVITTSISLPKTFCTKSGQLTDCPAPKMASR